jgi:hypothetical protein
MSHEYRCELGIRVLCTILKLLISKAGNLVEEKGLRLALKLLNRK